MWKHWGVKSFLRKKWSQQRTLLNGKCNAIQNGVMECLGLGGTSKPTHSNLCHGLVVPNQIRLSRAPSSLALGTSRDGASTFLWAAVPGPHQLININSYGLAVVIPVSVSQRALCQYCGLCSHCPWAKWEGPNATTLFCRKTTQVPAVLLGWLWAHVRPAKILACNHPKIQWECGKCKQGKGLRLYLTENPSWLLHLQGRKAAVTGMTYLTVTFGKAPRRATHILCSLKDIRERYLMIFSSCSTCTGLQLMTTCPPPIWKAAAPAPVLPAAAPIRNSSPAPAPAIIPRIQPALPAALLRCSSLLQRARSPCKAWSWSFREKWMSKKRPTRSKLKGNVVPCAAPRVDDIFIAAAELHRIIYQ